MSFIGLLPPGMLNMTSVQQSIENGMKNASLFSAGAATTVGIQALIALSFAGLLSERPDILQGLEFLAIPIFILLAIYFYIHGSKQVNKTGKKSNRSPYLAGLVMSSFNTISIPFYFGYCTLFEYKEWISIVFPNTLFIVLGAALGAFSLFYSYGRFAQYIIERVSFVAKNINFILSGFFILLTIIMVIKKFILI